MDIILTMAILAAVIIGYVVWVRDSRHRINLAFLGLCVSGALWTFTNLVFPMLDGKIQYVDALVSYGAVSMFATFFVMFAHALVDGSKKIYIGLFLIGLLASVVWSLPSVIATSVIDNEIKTTQLLYGYAAWIVGAYAYGLKLLIVDKSRVGSVRQKQIKSVIFGIVLTFIGAGFFNLLLPLLGEYQFVQLGPIFSLIFMSFFAYSIIKHRMFDVRAAAARFVAYGVSVVLISLALGFGVVLAISELELEGVYLQLAIVIAVMLATSLYPSVKVFFDKITEKIFFQNAYDSQSALDTITGLMVQVKTVEELMSKVSHTLQKYIGAESVTITLTTNVAAQRTVYSTRTSEDSAVEMPTTTQGFMLAHEQRVMTIEESDNEVITLEMSKIAAAMISQLRSQTGLVGYIIFGYKQNGSRYTKRDVEFIDIVSDEFAIAIQNMQRFEEISKFNQELQQKIDDATTELRITNEKLHELDKSKDEFISMASHQLRTPLTAVKGYISMVLEDGATITQAQRQMLEQAYESSQRMVFLIGDFLNVSRMQTGKFVLEASDMELTQVVEQEVDQLRDTAKHKQIELEYIKPSGQYPLYADENKLRQVMMNFIDNAIYYSRPGGKVAIQLIKEQGNYVFKVVDSGIGVPKDEQPNLFTKFYRASNARQQRPDGTGIGLYMAKKVVLAHGGTVLFETKEGVGSTFGFRLPLKNDLKQPSQQQSGSTDNTGNNGANLS